jgi:hypothetical protein
MCRLPNRALRPSSPRTALSPSSSLARNSSSRPFHLKLLSRTSHVPSAAASSNTTRRARAPTGSHPIARPGAAGCGSERRGQLRTGPIRAKAKSTSECALEFCVLAQRPKLGAAGLTGSLSTQCSNDRSVDRNLRRAYDGEELECRRAAGYAVGCLRADVYLSVSAPCLTQSAHRSHAHRCHHARTAAAV